MNRKEYDAAAEGDFETFKAMTKDAIEGLVTVTNNTILHVHIMAKKRVSRSAMASSAKFVEQVLHLFPSSFLLKENDKGDTLLHTAVKCNRVNIVQVLIDKAKCQNNDEEATTYKEMIGRLNNERNTALHEAVCRCSMDIVQILVTSDTNFSYSANIYDETLFMAAARGSFKIVAKILENPSSPVYRDPSGKTALHAAIITNSSEDVTKQILEEKTSLIGETDEYGWTPLHYAAYFGWIYQTEQLLKYDSSAAKIVDKDGKITPLHLAAAQGHAYILNLIISSCGECCELVDARGWNVLHFAVLSFNAQDLKNLLKKPLVRILIDEKDFNGNTPLHVLAAFCGNKSRFVVGREGDYHAVNKQNRSVQQIMAHGSSELKQEIQELSKGVDNGQYPNGFIKITEDKWKYENRWKITDEQILRFEKAAESQLVVAALIATVTFAAGFTLPGGYRNEVGPNQGTAILSRKSAFQAFVITDTIAMVLSLSAVFLYFIRTLEIYKKLKLLAVFAPSLTLLAMIAMVIAFITGTYAMLSPSLGLAILTCFIVLSFFPLNFYVLRKAVSLR